MSRPVSSTTSSEIALTRTRPLYLLQLGFNVPVRYSSREQVTWDSLIWSAASFRLSMTGQWSIDLFNETLLLGQTVLTQGTTGRTAKVWQLHGDGPTWAADDAEALLDGEMGEAIITPTTVSIALKKRGPLRTPRLYFNPPLCNHLPADGTVIRTANGETTELTTRRSNMSRVRRVR